MSAQNSYIKSLDGLRAIAIILVMSFHAEITYFGWFGVQLFFVLSGFLITGILWNEKQLETSLANKFKKFWVRRSLRIFPLYFGYLIVISLLYLFFHFPSYYSNYAVYLFTYTFNYTRTLPQWQGNPLFTHLWSLCIEEQFYVCFPILIFLLPSKFIKYLMFAIIIITPVTRLLLGEYYTNKGLSQPAVADAVYWNTLSHLDAFCIGGLIPVLSLHKKIKKPQLIFFICFFIAAVVGFVNYIKTDADKFYLTDLGYNHGQTILYEHIWHYTVLNFLFGSFILMLVTKNSNRISAFANKVFETNWMVRVGKVSYGMYIFHWLIFVYFYNKFFHAEALLYKILLFIPYVFLVYLVAELSFRLYESKFLKLKDKFSLSKTSKEKNTSTVLPISDSVSM